MNKIQFLNLIDNSIKEIEKDYSDNLFQYIQENFKNYLKYNPSDMEIWIKYSLLYYHIGRDELETMKFLTTALNYDPDHVITKFILAYVINYALYPHIEVFEIACSIKTTNLEYLSIQEYIKSWYYDLNDKKLCKESLIKSINYCDTSVWNYRSLGLYYFYEEKNYREAGYCFQKALNNIKHIYTIDQRFDSLSIEGFINERLKGTTITEPILESLQELLESCK